MAVVGVEDGAWDFRGFEDESASSFGDSKLGTDKDRGNLSPGPGGSGLSRFSGKWAAEREVGRGLRPGRLTYDCDLAACDGEGFRGFAVKNKSPAV